MHLYWEASVRFAHYDPLGLVFVNKYELHAYINWTFNLFYVLTSKAECSAGTRLKCFVYIIFSQCAPFNRYHSLG